MTNRFSPTFQLFCAREQVALFEGIIKWIKTRQNNTAQKRRDLIRKENEIYNHDNLIIPLKPSSLSFRTRATWIQRTQNKAAERREEWELSRCNGENPRIIKCLISWLSSRARSVDSLQFFPATTKIQLILQLQRTTSYLSSHCKWSWGWLGAYVRWRQFVGVSRMYQCRCMCILYAFSCFMLMFLTLFDVHHLSRVCRSSPCNRSYTFSLCRFSSSHRLRNNLFPPSPAESLVHSSTISTHWEVFQPIFPHFSSQFFAFFVFLYILFFRTNFFFFFSSPHRVFFFLDIPPDVNVTVSECESVGVSLSHRKKNWVYKIHILM